MLHTYPSLIIYRAISSSPRSYTEGITVKASFQLLSIRVCLSLASSPPHKSHEHIFLSGVINTELIRHYNSFSQRIAVRFFFVVYGTSVHSTVLIRCPTLGVLDMGRFVWCSNSALCRHCSGRCKTRRTGESGFPVGSRATISEILSLSYSISFHGHASVHRAPIHKILSLARSSGCGWRNR